MEGDYANVVQTGLDLVDGAENPSGLQEDVFLIVASDVASFGVPVANPLTPLAVITISTNHVLNAGAAPIPVYSMFEKSDFESPLTGELLSKMFMPAITVFMPQPTAQNAGTFTTLKNCRFIVLIKRTNASTGFTQIGTVGLYAKIKEGKVAYGKGPTGEPGISFTLEAPSIHPYFNYTGTLPAPAA
jgi:hypothetical protein